MKELKDILINRLERKGVGQKLIPGFMRSLANSFYIDPHMNLKRVNRRLQYLGWDDFDLDYHTFQLAIACIEERGSELLSDFPWHRLESLDANVSV